MTLEHVVVLKGESIPLVAKRLAPTGSTVAQRAALSTLLAYRNGYPGIGGTVYPGQILLYLTDDIPVVVNEPAPPPPPPATGYGVDPALRLGPTVPLTDLSLTGTVRTSSLPGTVVNGVKVIAGHRFIGNGGYLYVDTPTRFIDCATLGIAPVGNTSAIIQAATGNTVELVRWSHDGGPNHCRGVQADYGVTVRQSTCTRFGNAAIEMNNRTGTGDMLVEDSLFIEPSGWPAGDHTDGIQVGGGRNVTIRRCTVLITPYRNGVDLSDGSSNAPIAVWAETGNVTGNVLIDRCRVGGGNLMLYLQCKTGYQWPNGATVTNTMFDRTPAELGGLGPAYPGTNGGLLYPDHVPVTQAGNVYEDGTPAVLG